MRSSERWSALLARARRNVAVGLVVQTAEEFVEDKAPRLGAALAYYALFSLAPLLVIAIALAGLFFGAEAARGQVVAALAGLLGEKGASAVQSLIASAWRPRQGVVAAALGLVTLLVGASGVFWQLEDALNTIWEVERKPGRGVKKFLKERVLSFGLVLGVGFLLLVSLLVTAGLSAMTAFAHEHLPGSDALWLVLSELVTLVLLTLVFAALYRVVPSARIRWRDVAIGAFATAVLFTLGKALLGLYLARSAVASSFGAAGSVAILLVWMYYSAQLFLFGAEFTQVYANRFGPGIRPAGDARPATERARRQQGLKG